MTNLCSYFHFQFQSPVAQVPQVQKKSPLNKNGFDLDFPPRVQRVSTFAVTAQQLARPPRRRVFLKLGNIIT